MNLRSMKRRIRRLLRRVVFGASRALMSAIRYQYRGPIVVERVTIHIPSLPAHLKGFTIGVLTDLHLGPLVDTNFVRSAAELLAAERPDLVAVTGDFVSEGPAAALLGQVLAPVRGAVGVLGNWDYECSAAVRGQETVAVLVNAGTLAAPGLWVAGVDEVQLGAPDLDGALAGAPEGAVRVLLCHEPDFADKVEARHRVALQISGHSHGGQIRFPLIGPLLLPPGGRRYVAGLYQAAHCQVYTSRGVGCAHLPIRWNCPPEISLLVLDDGGANGIPSGPRRFANGQ